MNKKNNERGITLITLVITIMALSALAITIVANTRSMLNAKNITELKSDINNLKNKVSDFYNEYGELPVDIEYTNISNLANVLNDKEKNSKFYVIDLQAMQGVSLNYGRDYEYVKNTNTETANQYYDLYIINEVTHNIFYMKDPDPPESDDDVPPIGYTIEPVQLPETNGKAFSRENGKIDILFLTGTSYTVGQANEPAIDENNMVPVNWDSTNSKWVVTDETDWDYSYGDTNETRKWANVMLRDVLEVEGITDAKTASIEEMKGKNVTKEGSMLVWLPRYAYKITYYAPNDTNKTGDPIGYSDARGLVDSNGKTPEGMSEPVTSIAIKDNYRPHPAFEDGSSTGYKQGEWSSKLTGIWMGKFETTPKVNSKITIKPNTASYRSQTIGTFYTDAQDLGIANSHMAKNSEWGAMAYLTESKYGRNGTAVTRDSSNSSYLTGGTNGYKASVDQSTTNNVYGIYDTVGGAYEYTAGYVADSSIDYGNSFASTNPSDTNATNNKTESTQYATVYAKADSDSYTENYTANINKVFGDGIIETSTAGRGATSWHSANSGFVGLVSSSYYPFFLRGGYYSYSDSGSFVFSSLSGSSLIFSDFRVCLAVR